MRQGLILALLPAKDGLVPYWAQAALDDTIVETKTHLQIVDAKGKAKAAFPKDQVVALLIAQGDHYVLQRKVRLG